MYPDYLYIITENWYLYQVKISQEIQIEKIGLNLINITSVPMTDVWPAFESQEFQNAKDTIINIYSYFSNSSEWYMMFSIPNKVSSFHRVSMSC